MKYFAILKDSLLEAIDTKVFYVMAGPSALLILLALTIRFEPAGDAKEIMQVALAQAKEGRHHILAEMQKAMPTVKTELSDFAPRLITIKINPEKIRDVIGKGGAVIRALTEEPGCQINIEEDGTITIAATDADSDERQ